MSNSWIDGDDGAGIFCDADAENNLLQLSLKKPKSWNWELTTSRSSPNIAMPRIMLFNHKGQLLADAFQQVDEAVYRSTPNPIKKNEQKYKRSPSTNIDNSLKEDEDTGLGSLDSAEKNWNKPLSNDSLRFKRKPVNFRRKVERTANNELLKKEWRNSAPNEIDLDSLQICEVSDSSKQSPIEDILLIEDDINIDTPWRRKSSLKKKYVEPLQEDFSQADNYDVKSPESSILSDKDSIRDNQIIPKSSWKSFHSNGHLNIKPTFEKPYERRASSFKEVRFKDNPIDSDQKQKERRLCRRSNTNGLPSLTHSSSFLERQSAMKCRFSSPEIEQIENHSVQMGPRYFLRSSRAGTLVIAEEVSNNRHLRRRQPKNSSTENFLSHSNSSIRQKGLLQTSLGDSRTHTQSVNNFAEYNGNSNRRKIIPMRRNKSDGNIIVTSSDEETERFRNKTRHRKDNTWRRSHCDAVDQINNDSE